jgi:hypothetical protein
MEMTVRKRRNSRQRSRQRKQSADLSSDIGQTNESTQESIFGITIHRTDRLKTDLRLRHPIVHVHFIDSKTRSYMRKADPYVDFILFERSLTIVIEYRLILFEEYCR